MPLGWQVACPSAPEKALPRGQRAKMKVLAGLTGESTSARVLRSHPARGRLCRRCRKCSRSQSFHDGAQFLHALCTVVEAYSHQICDLLPCVLLLLSHSNSLIHEMGIYAVPHKCGKTYRVRRESIERCVDRSAVLRSLHKDPRRRGRSVGDSRQQW